jgi:hypothetical protein
LPTRYHPLSQVLALAQLRNAVQTVGCQDPAYLAALVRVIVHPCCHYYPRITFSSSFAAGITMKLAVRTTLTYPASSSVRSCDALFAAWTEEDFITAKRVLSEILVARGYEISASQMSGLAPTCEVVSTPSSRRRRRLAEAFVFALSYEFQVKNVGSDTALLVRFCSHLSALLLGEGLCGVRLSGDCGFAS